MNSKTMPTVERVSACARRLDALAELLIDAVDSGASVGFLPPLSLDAAYAYWHGVDASLPHNRVLLTADVGGELAGAVQLELAAQPNGTHRAEVQKLFVMRRFRRHGIARALMLALETEAIARGRSLLVLDTRVGDPAERLYEQVGYQRVGVIPAFARSVEGTLDATVLFYKTLGA
jgi:acetyltransferase